MSPTERFEEVRKLRMRGGLSLQDIADRLGVGLSTVKHDSAIISSGHRKPWVRSRTRVSLAPMSKERE